jgi:uncharacterized membrane protein YdjX (TVP38/TMEM64 family)
LKRGKKVGFWLKILAPVLASIAGLLTLRLLGPDVLDQQTLRAFLQPLGVWAPLVFVLLLAIRPVTLLPGQVFTAVGGILFGAFLGTVYALLGSLLASALVFLVSRKLGTQVMKRFAGKNFGALETVAKKHDFKVAAMITINPLFPTDVMVALAGASGARFWPTAVGVLLGTAPGTFLTAQFGASLSRGETVMTAVAAGGMVLSMVLGVFLGRRIVGDFNTARKEDRDQSPRGPGGGQKLAQAT